jgi:hypothetical protein
MALDGTLYVEDDQPWGLVVDDLVGPLGVDGHHANGGVGPSAAGSSGQGENGDDGSDASHRGSSFFA